ncbi:MAG: hypothetical protein ACJ77M_10215 [Thermoleophilaceae bacterium]
MANGDGDGDGTGTTTATRVRDRDATTTRRPLRGTGPAAATAADASYVRARDEFGGINWGAAFFGWLVATGLATILVAIEYAAGAAIGLTKGSASRVDIIGGAILIGIFALAYLCGGYVAGRMSRFDGFRQGLATWIVGLILTGALAAAGAIWGSKYDVLGALHMPRIPVDEGSIATGGAIALAAALIASFVCATFGGKLGERYHRRVDRVARTW